MPGVHIVTDSGSDLSPEDAAALGVTVVPLSIRFGEEEYVDRVTLGVEEFYAKMAELPGLPGTAAPSPGAFAEAFTKAADDGFDAVVCINLAGKMSATIEAARNAATSVADRIPVTVVDSQSVTGGLGALIRRAAAAAKDGQGADEIAAMVEDRAARTRIYGAFDTLENLKMGGRIGGAKALLGTLLSIKPIIEVKHGEVVEAGKQGTRRLALEWIRARVDELGDVEDLTICEGMATDLEMFQQMFADRPGGADIPVVRLGATIGTHGGPRVMGVSLVLPPDAS
jgi:DegV family protein with EDD domain